MGSKDIYVLCNLGGVPVMAFYNQSEAENQVRVNDKMGITLTITRTKLLATPKTKDNDPSGV